MPDATHVLKQDHRKVEGLFRRYQSGDDSVVETICNELKVHTTIEEQVLYPILPEIRGGERMRDEAEREHREVKDAIAEIERIGFRADGVSSLMKSVIEGVNHHVSEEENELLPSMTEQLGDDRMMALGDQLQAAKREELVSMGLLVDLTKHELYELAKTSDIPGRSDMTKHQLIEALQQ